MNIFLLLYFEYNSCSRKNHIDNIIAMNGRSKANANKMFKLPFDLLVFQQKLLDGYLTWRSYPTFSTA